MMMPIAYILLLAIIAILLSASSQAAEEDGVEGEPDILAQMATHIEEQRSEGQSEPTDEPENKIDTYEYKKDTLNYESILLERGKTRYEQQMRTSTHTDIHTQTKKLMLCATFIRANNAASTALLANMLVMHSLCDWAIVIYGGTHKYETEMCTSVRTLATHIHTHIRFCQRSFYHITSQPLYVPINTIDTVLQDDASILQHREILTINMTRSVPKTALYHELLPYIHTYEYVFLLDEDISLMGFNATEALTIWKCSFHRPPLIAQPLVYEDTQFFGFVTHASWYMKKVLASASGIVEQQVYIHVYIYIL